MNNKVHIPILLKCIMKMSTEDGENISEEKEFSTLLFLEWYNKIHKIEIHIMLSKQQKFQENQNDAYLLKLI